MRRKKDVTMQDIADYLSISKVTVSKALNGKDGVGGELRERVVQVAKDLNYKLPDSAFGPEIPIRHVAVFMKEKFAQGEAGFYLKFYQRISIELGRHGYFARLCPVSGKDSVRGRLMELPGNHDISGLILLGDLGKAFLSGAGDTGLPCILVDSYDREARMDCVITENIYSMYRLTSHLMEWGHTKIGFVGSVPATNSITDRFLGYCRAHLEAGLPILSEWIIGDRDPDPDSEDVELTLPKHMPTAFVCNCDDTAYQFVRLLTEKGYRVPEDVSIVSFDNDIHAELCVPPLTTAEVNIRLMARKSVELIRDKIELNHEQPFGVTFVNPAFIYRASVKDRRETEEDRGTKDRGTEEDRGTKENRKAE